MLKMQLSVLAVVLALGVILTPTTLASEQELRTDLQQAQEEIRQLRAELDEVKQLRTELQQLKDQGTSYQAEMAQAFKDIPAAGEGAESGTFIIPAGWTIKPYGYIKADIIYDDSKTSGGGDFCFYAQQEDSTTRSDDGWAFTARQTRLGAIITAPNVGDAAIRGLIETDFYGSGDNGAAKLGRDNVQPLRIRRAFGEIKGNDWLFLFGQEWEILSPLFPDTLNFAYGAAQGNMGFRQPQVRFDKWWDLDDGMMFKLQTALQREINNQNHVGAYDNGLDTSRPTVLARASIEMPSCLVDDKKMIFGISGHHGEEEVDYDFVAAANSAGADINVDSWSVCCDWIFPITAALDFRGELWTGENLDSHDGGIWQGINTATGHEIAAKGGWAQLTYVPCAEWLFRGGLMVDNPQDGDLEDGDRKMNHCYFAQGRYYFSKYLWTGLEVSYFDTQYKGAGADDGDNFRVQHSWTLEF